MIKKRHTDRNQNEENERQIKIEERLNCKLHRINLDVEDFDIFLEISKIQNYVNQSNKEKQKSKFAKELLNYISSISMPLKHIRYFAKKNATHNVRHEKHEIKNKTNENRKKPGTTYCLGCKDCTHNFRPQEVKMTNKVLREKSNCFVCRNAKSRFF